MKDRRLRSGCATITRSCRFLCLKSEFKSGKWFFPVHLSGTLGFSVLCILNINKNSNIFLIYSFGEGRNLNWELLESFDWGCTSIWTWLLRVEAKAQLTEQWTCTAKRDVNVARGCLRKHMFLFEGNHLAGQNPLPPPALGSWSASSNHCFKKWRALYLVSLISMCVASFHSEATR